MKKTGMANVIHEAVFAVRRREHEKANGIKTPRCKERARQQLNEDIETFLKNGGQIQQIEYGVMASEPDDTELTDLQKVRLLSERF